jgi:hypothetical protein
VRKGRVPCVEYVRTELAAPDEAATAARTAIARATQMLRKVTPTAGHATADLGFGNRSLRTSYRWRFSCPKGRSAGSSAP